VQSELESLETAAANQNKGDRVTVCDPRKIVRQGNNVIAFLHFLHNLSISLDSGGTQLQYELFLSPYYCSRDRHWGAPTVSMVCLCVLPVLVRS